MNTYSLKEYHIDVNLANIMDELFVCGVWKYLPEIIKCKKDALPNFLKDN